MALVLLCVEDVLPAEGWGHSFRSYHVGNGWRAFEYTQKPSTVIMQHERHIPIGKTGGVIPKPCEKSCASNDCEHINASIVLFHSVHNVDTIIVSTEGIHTQHLA